MIGNEESQSGPQARIALPSFAVTMFASAALVFSVQPMVGRMLLPKLGGTPIVWNTCLVFFQAALLIGYLYAHLLSSRLELKHQLLVHAGALLVAAAFLPLGFSAAGDPSASAPIQWLLVALTSGVAVPFVVLSASAPLFQSWFARTGHSQASDPYHLYAASNLGSLSSLIAYPFVVEPQLGLSHQTVAWAAGFGVLALLTLGIGRVTWVRARELGATRAFRHTATEPIAPRDAIAWFAYSAIPSALLVAVTTYVTSDVASVPLLWLIPLVLYLATFVVVFARRQPISHGVRTTLLPVVLLPMAVLLGLRTSTSSIVVDGAHHIIAFAVITLVLHGELARRRPAAEHSTAFYLMMSLGGVCGGALVALVAPLVFSTTYEYPLALAAAALAMPPVIAHAKVSRWVKIAVSVVGLLYVAVLYLVVMQTRAHNVVVDVALWGVLALLVWAAFRKPFVFGLGFAALLGLGTLLANAFAPDSFRARSYFGTYRVEEKKDHRVLIHGRTFHGAQWTDPGRRRTPMTYYSPGTGVGRYLQLNPPGSEPQKIGVVGLGVGELAAYANERRLMTFYEIDPLCEEIARDERYFHYLSDCGVHCDVVLGDGRIQLGLTDQKYDMLVEDAFSSDSVPMHLLTREAFALYRERLKPDGVLAFHITNAYFEFAPFLGRLAGDAGLHALLVWVTPEALDRGEALYPAWWVLMARERSLLASMANRAGAMWLEPDLDTPLWTDDFADPLAAYSP